MNENLSVAKMKEYDLIKNAKYICCNYLPMHLKTSIGTNDIADSI